MGGLEDIVADQKTTYGIVSRSASVEIESINTGTVQGSSLYERGPDMKIFSNPEPSHRGAEGPRHGQLARVSVMMLVRLDAEVFTLARGVNITEGFQGNASCTKMLSIKC